MFSTTDLLDSDPLRQDATCGDAARAAPMDPVAALGAALEAGGVDLQPLADALEAAGLNPGLVFRPGAEGRISLAAIDHCRMNVTIPGGLESQGWALAREDITRDWYGRPQQGRCPWGFGPAPRGRALAQYLLALVDGGAR